MAALLPFAPMIAAAIPGFISGILGIANEAKRLHEGGRLRRRLHYRGGKKKGSGGRIHHVTYRAVKRGRHGGRVPHRAGVRLRKRRIGRGPVADFLGKIPLIGGPISSIVRALGGKVRRRRVVRKGGRGGFGPTSLKGAWPFSALPMAKRRGGSYRIMTGMGFSPMWSAKPYVGRGFSPMWSAKPYVGRGMLWPGKPPVMQLTYPSSTQHLVPSVAATQALVPFIRTMPKLVPPKGRWPGTFVKGKGMLAPPGGRGGRGGKRRKVGKPKKRGGWSMYSWGPRSAKRVYGY